MLITISQYAKMYGTSRQAINGFIKRRGDIPTEYINGIRMIESDTVIDFKRRKPKSKLPIIPIGTRFGMLEVIGKPLNENGFRALYPCKCDCGNTKNIERHYLVEGKTTSCGCLSSDSARKNIVENSKVGLIEKTRISTANGTRKTNSNNSSGYKGVSWDKRKQRWRSYITFQGICYELGYYENISDAINERKMSEKKLYGEFLKWYEKEKSKKRTGNK